MTTEMLHEQLARALEMDGCAVCRVVTSVLYDEMCRLQHDDAAIADDASAGVVHTLCGTHLWYLFDLTSPAALVRLLEPYLRLLAADAGANTARCVPASLIPRDLSGSFPCPACGVVGWTTVGAVDAIAAQIRDEAPAADASNLCAPHVAAVAGRLEAPSAQALLERWAAATGALAARLDSAAADAAGPRRKRLLRFAPARAAIQRIAGWRTHGGMR